MEYCPYDSAFEITQPIQEKKKKKKQQKQNLEVFDSFDPDRPALANKTDILSLQTLSEAFVDISSNFVAPKLSEFKALPKYFLNSEDEFAEPFTDVIGSEEEPTQPSLPLIDNWKPVTPSNSYTAFYNESAEPSNNVKPPPVKPVKFNPYNDTKQYMPTKVMTEDSSSNDIVSKIDLLFKRLDALEKECKGNSNPNNQKELLYFVGTGFVFLVGIHLLRR
jgi:hypothetical protein